MSLAKGRWLPILIAILVIFLVIVLVFLATHSRRATPTQESPTSTQAPVDDSNYWTKERMESATPAPMPSP